MLKQLWTQLLGTRSKRTLKDILSDSYNREGFLGVRKESLPNPDRIVSDIERVIQYARTEDYAIWAQEAWTKLIDAMDHLVDPDLEPSRVDFYRGVMQNTLDLLRISYNANFRKQEAARYSQGKR